MRSSLSILTTLAFLGASACSQDEPRAVPVIEVSGAAIDGSEDVPEQDPAPSEVAEENLAAESASPARANGETPADGLATEEPVAGEASAPTEDGPLDLTYQDLSLVDYDVDAMLDCMLFPEEYDAEDREFLAWPEHLTRLMGREVSITGYMIPGEMDQGEVTDFMLVRDLLGCCFGGTPMPDEWVDVVMEEGETAEYRPYLPMRVTGVMRLEGEQDEAGFAMGIYRMRASDVQVED